MPLVSLPLWHGHLGLYRRTCGCRSRQTPSISSLIGGIFRPFKEASQASGQLHCITQITMVWEVKLHQLLCWAPGQVLNSWFLAILGELLSLGILGVATVEDSWKSNVTTNLHVGSMMGSWRKYWRESRNVPHPVLSLFVVGSDATVVCPYCMNISV